MEGSVMKKFSGVLICSLILASAYSQSIKVSFNGNREFQLVVDGKTYNSESYASNDLVLNNLYGEHSLRIYRVNKRGKSKEVYSSTVNLSPGEEIQLVVNRNGSIERTETSSSAAYGYRSPMSDASFNEVYRNISNQWWQSGKMSTARDAFNTGNYYFSTDQVRRIVELISADEDRLELLKLAYDNVTDPSGYYQLSDLLRSQQSRNELNDYIRNDNYGDPYNSYQLALSEASFNQLYQNILDQRSTSQKLSAATAAFNSAANYFTVSQASRIISLITGENNRLQLAKLSLDNIVDRENLTRLYDLLSTQSARENLDYYIRSNGYAGSSYNYNFHSAMTDSEFNTLYNDISKKWFPLSKYYTAKDVFNSTTNYFTTEQAKQIIGLLSSESNRLELAKLAFDNIVDQQNFRQLSDLFTSQSSKDELDEYVKANSNYQF